MIRLVLRPLCWLGAYRGAVLAGVVVLASLVGLARWSLLAAALLGGWCAVLCFVLALCAAAARADRAAECAVAARRHRGVHGRLHGGITSTVHPLPRGMRRAS